MTIKKIMVSALLALASGGGALASSGGQLDASFGQGGIKVVDLGGVDQAFSVNQQADGKLLVSGYTDRNGTSDFVILRLNSGGVRDTSFDKDGMKVIDFGGAMDYGYQSIQQTDGKLVIAGLTNKSGTYDFAIVRLHSDGSLDASFDGDGKKVIDLGGAELGGSVLQQSDGKLVIAGYTNKKGTDDVVVVRLNSDGSRDTSFDGDGVKLIDLGANDYGSALVQQPDGKLVISGFSDRNGSSDVLALRLNTNGSLDTTFDKDGFKLVNLGRGAEDKGYGLALQPDGKLVIAGATDVDMGIGDMLVVRLNTDGSLDAGFGNGGKKIIDLGYEDAAMSLVVRADGRAVIAGYGVDFSSGLSNIALVQLMQNGSLDVAFDEDGALVRDLGGEDELVAAFQQVNGKLVVAGKSDASGTDDIIILRLQP